MLTVTEKVAAVREICRALDQAESIMQQLEDRREEDGIPQLLREYSGTVQRYTEALWHLVDN